ncbi:S8 family serine peptidase [Deinococcus koreensis]|uniref:Peptidase S8 n=1 Tax=Deinococcus koreensis TaxID=2054903 RepID=A0A2K3V0R4_9DEIO|nr:S8 family serine peptidase [Deinococcus koreensis]PNY82362.1 peptidase S8 [Deinococcus koreensis]
MKKASHPISYMALAVLAMAMTACGGTPAVTPSPEASQPTTQTLKLVTVRIGAGVTEGALKASVPGSEVLVFDHATSRAVLSVPETRGTLQAASLNSLSLGALDAGVLAVEPNVVVSAPDDVQAMGMTTWAGGATTWAGGMTTWAGGALTWAGGASFLDASTMADVQAYWNRLELSRAHTLMPEKGTGIKVAVIDTGVDLAHPLLQNSLDTTLDWDFVGNDDSPAEETALDSGKYGHGTATVGIILQMAPNTKIQMYRALKPDGSGSMDKVVAAVNKAVANGARVINMSLGTTSDSSALNTAIAAALAKGIVVVNSVGNAGTEGLLYPSRKLDSASFAATSGLIGVGSVTKDLKRSSFSQYALNMSLTAPGEQVLTTYPGSKLMRATGTSFAAPAVTGAVALAMSAGVTNVSTLSTGLRTSVTPNQDVTFNSKLGTGTLNVGSFADLYR